MSPDNNLRFKTKIWDFHAGSALTGLSGVTIFDDEWISKPFTLTAE
jgi:hypothetical protein